MEVSQEYLEGYRAGKQGLSLFNCPYPFTLESNKRDEWISGLKDSRKSKN